MDEPDITTVLWRHRLVVLACVLVCVGAAVLATVRADEVYEARVTLQAGAVADRGGFSAEGNQALARSYAEVMTSGSFLERVRDQLPGSDAVRELQDDLTAEALPDTAVVRLEARGPSPAEARDLAAAVTSAFISTLRVDTDERVLRRQRELDQVIDDLTRRIERPASGVTPAQVDVLRASRRALVQQGAALVTDGVSEAVSARRVGPPSASADPVSPRPRLNVIAGIVVGLLLGASLAWWRERRALPLRSPEEVAERTDVPVLATIPLRRRASPSDPMLAEAYDVLRANLMFQSLDRRAQVLAIVSENSRVGKSSTVEGLAYAGVRAGDRVVIIDADLRLGELSKRLGYQGGASFADVVSGRASIDEALIEVAPGLRLMPARPPTADPPRLLNSPQLPEIVADLRRRFDQVLVDSPPMSHLADGLLLASVADGALIIVRPGTTSRPDLSRSVRKVRQTRTEVTGLVVFAAQGVDSAYNRTRTATLPAAEGSAGLR